MKHLPRVSQTRHETVNVKHAYSLLDVGRTTLEALPSGLLVLLVLLFPFALLVHSTFRGYPILMFRLFLLLLSLLFPIQEIAPALFAPGRVEALSVRVVWAHDSFRFFQA